MANAFYQPFTSARLTEPDLSSLISQLKAQDASAGVQHVPGPNYVVKKSTAWTQAQINFTQTTIDNAPATSLELSAQANIDAWPIEWKALCLALIDQLNIIRAALPNPLGPITPAQALAAVRAKAGTL